MSGNNLSVELAWNNAEYPYKMVFVNKAYKPDIDEETHINGLVDCSFPVKIGKHVFTGHDVMILTASHNYYKFGHDRSHSENIGGPVTIEEGVWIATRAIIIGPCKIGKHSVIGAGSVVTKDVPAYQVWVGNPAHKLKDIPHESVD
jgi:acetyltransferase-like isoleucine patch superfamily enzyme